MRNSMKNPTDQVEVAFLQIMSIIEVKGKIKKNKLDKIYTKLSQKQKESVEKKLKNYGFEKKENDFTVKKTLTKNPFGFDSLFERQRKLQVDTSSITTQDFTSNGFVAVGYPLQIKESTLKDMLDIENCDYCIFIEPQNVVDIIKYLDIKLPNGKTLTKLKEELKEKKINPISVGIYFLNTTVISRNNLTEEEKSSGEYSGHNIIISSQNKLNKTTEQLISVMLNNKIVCKKSINYQKSHIKSCAPLNIDYLGARRIITDSRTISNLQVFR